MGNYIDRPYNILLQSHTPGSLYYYVYIGNLQLHAIISISNYI